MAGFYLLLAGGFWPLMGFRCQVSGLISLNFLTVRP